MPLSKEEGMKKYTDKYGDVWVRIDMFYVKRIYDGMIGGWFGGQGLTQV